MISAKSTTSTVRKNSRLPLVKNAKTTKFQAGSKLSHNDNAGRLVDPIGHLSNMIRRCAVPRAENHGSFSRSASLEFGVHRCLGQVGDGVLTVRFTYRDNVIRIIGAGYWRKGKAIYEKQNQIHE